MPMLRRLLFSLDAFIFQEIPPTQPVTSESLTDLLRPERKTRLVDSIENSAVVLRYGSHRDRGNLSPKNRQGSQQRRRELARAIKNDQESREEMFGLCLR